MAEAPRGLISEPSFAERRALANLYEHFIVRRDDGHTTLYRLRYGRCEVVCCYVEPDYTTKFAVSVLLIVAATCALC
jgi:hypothetical protein